MRILVMCVAAGLALGSGVRSRLRRRGKAGVVSQRPAGRGPPPPRRPGRGSAAGLDRGRDAVPELRDAKRPALRLHECAAMLAGEGDAMRGLAILLGVTATVTLLARVQAVMPAETLPFYDSPDFTPKWTRSVGHHVAPFNLVAQTGQPLHQRRRRGPRPRRLVHLHPLRRRVPDDGGAALQGAGRAGHQAWRAARVVHGHARRRHPGPACPSSAPPGASMPRGGSSSPAMPNRSTASRAPRTLRMMVGLDKARPASAQFLHTEKLLLVDRAGRLRGRLQRHAVA